MSRPNLKLTQRFLAQNLTRILHPHEKLSLFLRADLIQTHIGPIFLLVPLNLLHCR